MPAVRTKTRALLRRLDAAGAVCRCAVPGCAGSASDVHHVWPVAAGGSDDVDNLVYLCTAHHALVERYYFWARAKLAPDTCRELQAIARGFDRGTIPPLLVGPLGERTRTLWAQLNALGPCQNTLWWQATFARAIRWAVTQEVVREVLPKNAILEEPWFRTRSRTHQESENPLEVQRKA